MAAVGTSFVVHWAVGPAELLEAKLLEQLEAELLEAWFAEPWKSAMKAFAPAALPALSKSCSLKLKLYK